MTADQSSPPVAEQPAAAARPRETAPPVRGTRAGLRSGRWPLWLSLLAAVAGGAVTALAFPPFDLGLLALPGVVLGLAAMGAAGRPRRGAGAGWVFAATWYAILWSWLGQWGALLPLALAAGQALFWLPVGALAAALPRRRPVLWVTGVTAAWTLADAARARWPLGGWEWGQLGYALHGAPLRSAAALAGVLGLTFLVVAVCAAVAVAVASRRATGSPLRRWLLPVGAVAVLVLAAMAGGRAWTSDEGSLDVAIVQVDPACPGTAAVDCPREGETLLERYAEGTARVDDDVDLILWGEGAIGGRGPEDSGRAAVEAVGGRISENGGAGADITRDDAPEGDAGAAAEQVGPLPAHLLTGVTSPAGPGRFHNRNVLLTPDGEVVDAYAKRHLVPFGEYVPARSVLGRFYEVGRLVPRDAVPGDEPGRLPLGDVTIGTVSSFEGSVARAVRAVGPEVAAITVLSTVSSYGESPTSDQFLAMNRLRAAELQRSVAVASTTGRSTVIPPGGSDSPATDLMAADLLVEEVPLRSGATPYARYGDAPVTALAIVLLAAAGGVSRRPRPSVYR